MRNFGLHKDLNILLTAVRNILYLDNNVNGTHCWVFMATLNSFILFCIVYSGTAQQYTHNSGLRFCGNNTYANAPHYYIIQCLFFSLFHSILLAFITSFFLYFLLPFMSPAFLISFILPVCPVQNQSNRRRPDNVD